MRRLLLLLAAALLLTACAKQSPPAPAPAPVPPPEESTPAPAPNDSGLKPDPASGLQAVIKQASTSAFQRVAIPAGQPINREGLFFLNVATGAVEGWAIEGYPFFTVSDDNRWVTGQLHEGQYLAERKTGTVYNWSMRDAQLISIRGEVALFMTGTQFWLATGGLTAFQPTGIATAPGAQALIAPDGKAVALLADGLLLLIDTANGRSRQLAQVQAADYSPSGQLTVVAGGFTVWSQPESGRVRTQRYTWDGRLAAEQTTPGTAFFSPGGKLLAWHGSLLGLTDTLTIGTDAVKPLLRLRGEAACSLPYQGPYWLPDGSGIMVSTTRGPRLL
ncbi:MAG TPA: hypothetical protein VNT75_16125, partial [Symbiobacteriaceae bacterium]|nr:hypothetical protein [Symbiobacteriaceae bacterium]